LGGLRPLKSRKAEEAVADRVQTQDEAVPQCGSYEVRFSDGRPSKYFYWEDTPGRHLRSEQADSKRAVEGAKAFARNQRRTSRGRCSSLYAKAIANAITSAIIKPATTATPLMTLEAASSL
jgi:hypothetical protein